MLLHPPCVLQAGFLVVVGLCSAAYAQGHSDAPVASRCPSLPQVSNVACINQYAAVLPYPFNRTIATNLEQAANDSFRFTSVPADPSFGHYVTNSTFIVFEETRGSEILGSTPQYDFIFETRNDSVHEAPVYVPELQSIIYSLPHFQVYEQQLVNLTDYDNPTLRNFTTDPPVYAVNGGKYWGGAVYWAVEGGVPFPNPSNQSEIVQQAPGIYKLDPLTGRTTTLLNNYFGTLFNSPNDLWIDSVGDIWFTDSWYGYAINVTAVYPPLAPTTYRFRPSTGRVSVVEDTLGQPNGIAFSADESTCFITDTGLTDFNNPPADGSLPRYGLSRYGGSSVYAHDVRRSAAGNYLVNKRPIWRAEEFADDGFHISREGYLIGAAGAGVDVFSQEGEYLVRIYTNFTVNNVQFAGESLSDLWLFGAGGIARVKWNLHGILQE